MAEYIKLRASALKAGVSLALAALIGGLPARSHAATPTSAPRASTASGATRFLKLDGLSGSLGNSLLKVEKSFLKLDSALGTLEHKLAKTYFTAQKIDSTFLKIKSANSSFLKVDAANLNFLKIDAANLNFLKITDANSTFLKITDANASFLKIDDADNTFLKLTGTAANASELGGATPQSFSRSSSGAATVKPGDQPAALLASPEGELTVTVTTNPTGGQGGVVTITNNTGALLPAVQDVAGQDTSIEIQPKSSTPITLDGSVAQLHLQFFPVPGLFGSAQAEAATLVISMESNQEGDSFVGQLIAGSL
jgi:hypothetical protein